jgi:SulP family sulfate permease
MLRYLPFLDLARHPPTRHDLTASLAVVFLAVPQGIAYAMIAGLPPAAGLYAAAVPTMLGALFMSSRHVVAGPTNAVSLLVGAAIAAMPGDPVVLALQLALLIGLFQLLAGLLNLGALVDYVSGSVLRGYITGAAALIAVGQLHNVTRTDPHGGDLHLRVWGWAGDLGSAHLPSVGLALGAIAIILGIRAWRPKAPASVVAMVVGAVLVQLTHLDDGGVRLIRDLGSTSDVSMWPVLPPMTGLAELAPIALAATVLSLVESSSVGRALAVQSGQRLDTSVDFVGLGMANVASSFFGGYAVSGSLSRSVLNARNGAMSRASGLLAGVWMLGMLAVALPWIALVPIPVLAGVLMVVAADLVALDRIRAILRSGWGGRVAFAATLFGTWLFRLDHAIYLGVTISIVLFLRNARLLTVRELAVGESGRLREIDPEQTDETVRTSRAVRVLHVEGALFFGAANELRDAVERVATERGVHAVVLRMKRTQGLDYTTAAAITDLARAMRGRGQHLILVGMREDTADMLRRVGFVEEAGDSSFYPSRPRWFEAMDAALTEALRRTADAHTDDDCPLHDYLERRARERLPQVDEDSKEKVV